MIIKTDISVGEFLDKITILEIKSDRIKDPIKLTSINKELSILRNIWRSQETTGTDISKQLAELKEINESLWVIEDDIRDKEAKGQFDDEFIQLARSVYITNDRRAAVKRELNKMLGSELIEEKSYSDYTQGK